MAGAGDVLDDLAKAAPARPATEADTVVGVPARFVATPSSTDETAELLRVAARHDLAVVVRGSGTRLDWGGAPRRLDLVVDTARLSGVVDDGVHAAEVQHEVDPLR